MISNREKWAAIVRRVRPASLSLLNVMEIARGELLAAGAGPDRAYRLSVIATRFHQQREAERILLAHRLTCAQKSKEKKR